jgi:two-component system, response regulator PdtaR
VRKKAALQVSDLFGSLGSWGSRAPLFSPDEGGSEPSQNRPIKVLIVEDDHLVASGIEGALLDAGFEVTGIAASAEEAVQLASATKPDLAIMDIRLAGQRDGIDTAIELFREMNLRCVFATAYHDAETRLRAQPARPLAWIPKPYHPAALIRAILDALSNLSI